MMTGTGSTDPYDEAADRYGRPVTRLLSLAAGTVPELSPVETVRVAAAAGWPATGLWYDADSWTPTVTADVRRALDDTGLVALDLEPVFITPAGDHGDALVDTAAEVGARHVLVVGLGTDDATGIDRLGTLGARAAAVGVTCALEFGPLFATPDLATAVDTVGRAGGDSLAVLVDSLHLARSGGRPRDLAGLDPALLPYAQLCDATAEPVNDLRTDALDDRLLLGEGDLPIDELVAALPADTAISMELRSAALRSALAPLERAEHVLTTSVAALAR